MPTSGFPDKIGVMPTYVYRCTNCEKVFEVEQRITEPSLTDHDCGPLGTLKRVMQPVGVAFKGSGFHINDYNASGLAPAIESKTESAPAAESKPSAEATPAVPSATSTPEGTATPAPSVPAAESSASS